MVRLLLAILCAYAVMALLAPLLFGFVLAEQFSPLAALFRPVEEQRETVIWAYLAQFARTFAFVGMIVLLRGAAALSVAKGAAFGLTAGFFAGTFHVANAASLPLPAATALAWVAFDTVLLTVGGAVFALTYRPRPAQA